MAINITPLSQERIDEYLSIKDLTEDATHAIGKMYANIEKEMRTILPQSTIEIHRNNPIVPVVNNYDRLLFSSDNLGRSSTYTHYVTPELMLRTHTSANIPDALQQLAQRGDWEDITMMLPGLVYRRDITDRKHLSAIHQMDIWRVVRNSNRQPIGKDDLLMIVEHLAKKYAPGWTLRIVVSPHPYTKEGIEVNLVKGDQDIEILECGLINDTILQHAGLSPSLYSGWALGMGLDRMVMIHKDIPDIRYLRSDNPRIAKQMKHLEPYHEISLQPAISRDLSYCVPALYVEEDINEHIRTALGGNSTLLESVAVISETPYESLTPDIRKKLGCIEGQKNVLVRITLRHLSKTLTKDEANAVYDQIYKTVNYGTAGYI